MNDKNTQAQFEKDCERMIQSLQEIYSNKSSDEYKMRGDITASSEYETIEKMVTDIRTLKGFPPVEANEIKTLFLTLHRPIFKTMCNDYLTKPNEKNTSFTAVYTVGFRLLIGELSRIFASTEATDNGIVYKPDKISKKDNTKNMIRHYNNSIEQNINKYVSEKHSTKPQVHQESVAGIISGVGSIVSGVMNVVSGIFPSSSKEVRPSSIMNSMLMRSYDKKVQKFEDAAKNYQLAKEAYEDYMRIPQGDRKRRIEHKYTKLIHKYNIKMQHLKAKIAHFDERSSVEARENRQRVREDAILNEDDNDSVSNDTPSASSNSGSSASDFDF